MGNVKAMSLPHLQPNLSFIEVASTECLECGVSAPTPMCMTCGHRLLRNHKRSRACPFEVERTPAHTRTAKFRAIVHVVLRLQRLCEVAGEQRTSPMNKS